MSDSASTITWPSAEREAAFSHWLAPIAQRHSLDLTTLQPASADASFRRYLRLQGANGANSSFIVMDAPPPQENVRPFVAVASLIENAGLHAPRVLEADPELGFLLLTDLGHEPYLQALQAASTDQAERLMREALHALVQWQLKVDASHLPPFDAKLLRAELSLFPEWCVAREHGITWTATQQATWQSIVDLLVHSAERQPQLAVHADWMPRNLMVAPAGLNPGILDFQDAVCGPITYDLASLLRDAFISWPEEREIDWAVRWWQEARAAGLPVNEDFGEFWRALEWMGLQRHLKVLGIFCRLKHRDGKPRYVQDLPRFFAYATKVAIRYRPLAPLLPLLEPMSGSAVEAGLTF